MALVKPLHSGDPDVMCCRGTSPLLLLPLIEVRGLSPSPAIRTSTRAISDISAFESNSAMILIPKSLRHRSLGEAVVVQFEVPNSS
jgi:hypothetical protein